MQTRKALKRLSADKVDYNRVSNNGPLAENASWLLKAHAARTADVKTAQQRHRVASALPMLEMAKYKLNKMVGEQLLPQDAPIVTRFDAFTSIKNASKNDPRDMGLRKFALHLERLWHKDPMGTFSAGALSRYRDKYQHENPSSKVAEITNQSVSKVSFNNLPVAHLTRIASQIDTQEDYDQAIERSNLTGDHVQNVRARAFIRELVNKKAALEMGKGDELNPDWTVVQTKPDSETKDLVTPIDTTKKSGGDIAARVASRLRKEAQLEEPETEEKSDIKSEDLGVDGTGMMPIAFNMTSALRENGLMNNWAQANSFEFPKEAAAPEGWEKTVEDMKDHKDIDNPFALAHWMDSKGYEPSDKRSEKSDDGAAQKEFNPEVNDQCPPQGSQKNISKEDGAKVLKAEKKEAEIPEAFKKNIKKKKEDSDNGDETSTDESNNDGSSKDKDKDKGNPFAKKKSENLGLTAESIEDSLLSGKEIKVGSYSLVVTDKNAIRLASSAGKRLYPLFDMDAAIHDFTYLVDTSKGTSPSPKFYIREGMQIVCPSCGTNNGYEMPKAASSLSCGSCNFEINANMVAYAFKIGKAKEETTVVTHIPNDKQVEFGDKFASIAGEAQAEAIGAVGTRGEAYLVDPSTEKMANLWDKMVEAGFEFIAQEMPAPDMAMPTPTTSPMTAQDEPPAPPPGLDMPGPDMDMGMGMDMPPLDAPMDEGMLEEGPDIGDQEQEGPTWADHQVIQAAFMHYQHDGLSPISAIAQFNKDYGDEFDSETVLQVAATVWGVNLDSVKIALKKEADLPSTSVNTQQPDAVQPEKLGPDSETHGDIKEPSKVNPQVPAQSQSGTSEADKSTSPDSDNNDPGDFGAGKPKAQHPATDQSGTSLPGTDLGSHSDTQMGGTMNKMESESSGAYSNVRSALKKKASEGSIEVHVFGDPENELDEQTWEVFYNLESADPSVGITQPYFDFSVAVNSETKEEIDFEDFLTQFDVDRNDVEYEASEKERQTEEDAY